MTNYDKPAYGAHAIQGGSFSEMLFAFALDISE